MAKIKPNEPRAKKETLLVDKENNVQEARELLYVSYDRKLDRLVKIYCAKNNTTMTELLISLLNKAVKSGIQVTPAKPHEEKRTSIYVPSSLKLDVEILITQTGMKKTHFYTQILKGIL